MTAATVRDHRVKYQSLQAVPANTRPVGPDEPPTADTIEVRVEVITPVGAPQLAILSALDRAVAQMTAHVEREHR